MADEGPDHPIAGDTVFGFRSDTTVPWPALGTATRTWQEEDGQWWAELEDD